MSKRDVSYLQVKSIIEKILVTGERPSVDRICELLSGIASPEQVSIHLDRWKKEASTAPSPQTPTTQQSSSDQSTPPNSIEDLESRTAELKRSLSLVRATLESTADGMLMVNREGKLVDFNQKFLELSGLPMEVLETGDEEAGLRFILDQIEDPMELYQLLMRLSSSPEEQGNMGEVRFKDGRIYERYSQPHRVGNEIVGRVWSFHDVTEQRKAEDALRLRERAIESSTHGVIICDNTPALEIIYANPAFRKITGYPDADFMGKGIGFLYDHEPDQSDIEKLKLAIKEQREDTVIIRCHCKDESLIWTEMFLAPVMEPSGEIKHYVIIVNDVTQRKALEEQLRHQATHDALTDLPNRALLQDRVQRAILQAKRENTYIAVIFLDLDRFKLINDGLGHNMGDGLLCAVAKRLKNCVRSTDTVARIGGDEFMIILSPVHHEGECISVVQHMMNEIRRTIIIEDRELNVSTSAGISIYPKDGDDFDTLMRKADTAMYQAKDGGRDNFQFFKDDMNKLVSERLAMENCLRHAIENEEFVLHYQPISNLMTGRVTSLEALIRWNSPQLGFVSPLEFIPCAEDMGLIIPIGNWVLETACHQCVEWHALGFEGMCVSVNVSGRQLMDDNFVHYVGKALQKTKLDPHFLLLELTESMLMDHSTETIAKLNALCEMGVQLAIDDFGTGYSSLSYLRHMPVHKLKIDRSFVEDIGTDPNDEAIVLAIIAMSKSLNLSVIAEGVETKKQSDYLRKYQCDEVQGYYFSKPLDQEGSIILLKENFGLL